MLVVAPLVIHAGGQAAPGGNGDHDARLHRTDPDPHVPGFRRALVDELEVTVREEPLLQRLVDVDVGVDPRHDLETSRPIQRHHAQLEPHQMWRRHGDDPPLEQPSTPAIAVRDDAAAHQHPPGQVQVDAVLDELVLLLGEPRPAAKAQVHREPVGQVDKALELDPPPAHLRAEPVVEAGDVGAGVRDAVVGGPGAGPTGAYVAVGKGAQRLHDALVGGSGIPEAQAGIPPGGTRADHREIAEVLHHDVRPVLPQRRTLAPAIQADHDREAAPPARLDSCLGVLEHCGTAWLRAQSVGGLEEERGVGLSGEGHRTGDLSVDADVDEGAETRRVEHLGTVTARRDDPDVDAFALQALEHADRRRKGPDAVAIQQREVARVLVGGDAVDRALPAGVVRVALRQVDLPVLEDVAHAVLAAFAVDE